MNSLTTSPLSSMRAYLSPANFLRTILSQTAEAAGARRPARAAPALGAALFVLTPVLLAPGPLRADVAPARPIQIKLTDKQIAAAGIETRAMEPERESGELVAPGVVVTPPQQLRMVATPAAGLVESFLVAPDQDVKEGEPLAQLRSQDIVESQRAYIAAQAREALASEKLRRDQQLFREGIIAERRLLTTRAEASLARSELDERSQVLQLNGMSDEDIARLRGDRKITSTLTVRAPMSGVVLQRLSTPGERVAVSAPLLTIARLNPIWVNLQAPLSRAPSLAHVKSVAIPALGLVGRLVSVGRTADAATQSVLVVAEFDTRGAAIRPGQAVQATLRLNGAPGRYWRAPSGAAVEYRGREWIFVRNSEGFLATPIEKTSETADNVAFRADLPTSEPIAVRGVLTLLSEMQSAEQAGK